MRRIAIRLAVVLAVVPVAAPPPALAFPDADRLLCDLATSSAEHETGVPDQLLTAISRVETGRADPETGRLRSWPWTINVQGAGHFYATKAEAIAAVTAFRAAGAQSIDVGCMQVNLRQHPDAFGSLDQAFDPQANALWAARFLTDLFHETGSWPHAAAAYHSMTPEIGANYQVQVLRAWADGDGPVASRRNGHAGARAIATMSVAAATAPSGAIVGAAGDTASGASATASTGGSPFGGARTSFVSAHYDPSPTPANGGRGRGLDAYRAIPIALAARPLFRSRF